MHKQIFDLLKELKTYFFLNEYESSYEFTELKDGISAQIIIDPVYLRYGISISEDYFKKLYLQEDYYKITEILVHELCHTLTEHLYLAAIDGVTNKQQDNLEDTRERQTQRICNVIMRNLPKKYFLTQKGNDTKKPSKKTVKKGNKRTK